MALSTDDYGCRSTFSSLGELKENNLFKSPEERKDANGNVKSDLTFELEANNFFDKSGNIQKGSYMEDGWVDERPVPRARASSRISSARSERAQATPRHASRAHEPRLRTSRSPILYR